jgi:2-iminobutanoate/2-iminopropanoate deaminase
MKSGNLVFCSGQTPLDPKTMKLVGTTIEEQTKRVLNNLSLVLSDVGLSLKNIVKTTVYLKNMDDFAGMNKVYEEMFQGHKPSRTTISVKQNPLDALVEIECIAEIQS